DAEDGQEVERDADQHVAEQGTDHTKGDDRHDDQGLRVGSQRYRQQCVDAENGQHQAPYHVLHDRLLFRSAPVGAIVDCGVALEQLGEKVVLQVLYHFPGFHLRFDDVRVDGHRAFAFHPADACVAGLHAEFGNRVEGNQVAAGGTDVHAFEIANGASFLFRVTQHDAHFVIAALHALRLGAVESIADLAADVVQGQAHDLGLGSDAESQLFLAV